MPKKLASLRQKNKGNLVLPILALSTIITTTIGYISYRSQIKPIEINEVGIKTITCDEGYLDGYDGSSIDSTKWFVEINQEGESASIKNGALELSSPFSQDGIRVLGNQAIMGNFSAEIDISSPTTNPENDPSKYSQLVFREPTSQGNSVGITRRSNGQLMSYAFGGYYGDKVINEYSKYADIPKDIVVRVRINREGTGLKLFYKTNSNYILLGDYPDIARLDESMTPRLNLFSIYGNPPTATKATFDNFSLHCISPDKPPIPNNPRIVCSPDGKSVKFSWDSVNSVESYKIRLDNKKGKVTNYDNIKDTQKVVEINPNQPYSWWMHSHQGGYDSNQTTSVDFTCVPTTTPTPTPKSSIQPTPTPTPITYAIPSPKVLFDNTPTPTNTPNTIVDLSPSPNPESPTTKPGFFTRFFQWFSKLFN